MNPDTKSLFASKTIWGIVIAALPTIAGLLGYKIADVSAFTAGANEIVDSALALFGASLALYGRIKATSSLVIK
jgi:hypothetical protein